MALKMTETDIKFDKIVWFLVWHSLAWFFLIIRSILFRNPFYCCVFMFEHLCILIATQEAIFSKKTQGCRNYPTPWGNSDTLRSKKIYTFLHRKKKIFGLFLVGIPGENARCNETIIIVERNALRKNLSLKNLKSMSELPHPTLP